MAESRMSEWDNYAPPPDFDYSIAYQDTELGVRWTVYQQVPVSLLPEGWRFVGKGIARHQGDASVEAWACVRADKALLARSEAA